MNKSLFLTKPKRDVYFLITHVYTHLFQVSNLGVKGTELENLF